MEENIQMGLSMLIVGMTSVFVILLLIVSFGKLLIRSVNRLYPLEALLVSEESMSSDNQKIAAIVAAVDVATSGKGKVSSIKKIN